MNRADGLRTVNFEHYAARIRARRETGNPNPVDDQPDESRQCETCGGRAWLYAVEPGKKAWPGQAVPCTDCRDDRMMSRARQRYSLLPQSMRRLTFDTFDLWLSQSSQAGQDLRDARDAALAFALGELPTPWLVVMSKDSGVGKTHLAAAIVNMRLDMTSEGAEAPALWCNAPAWLAELRSGFDDGTYAARMREVQEAECLVIDDLGSEYHRPGAGGQSWASEQFFLLLDHRYVGRLPTVITTNASLMELPPRLASRLSDVGTGLSSIYSLGIPSYRLRGGR